jgi:hypothetical protein
MSNGAAAMACISTLDDDAWDDLLSFIEERRVIPIVGPELLPHRAVLLREAAAKLDSLPAAKRPLHDVKLWRKFIDAAQRGAG